MEEVNKISHRKLSRNAILHQLEKLQGMGVRKLDRGYYTIIKEGYYTIKSKNYNF
jgi:hypothetical protein